MSVKSVFPQTRPAGSSSRGWPRTWSAAQLLAGEQTIDAGPAADAVRAITARLVAAIEANPGYGFDVRLVKSDLVTTPQPCPGARSWSTRACSRKPARPTRWPASWPMADIGHAPTLPKVHVSLP